MLIVSIIKHKEVYKLLWFALIITAGFLFLVITLILKDRTAHRKQVGLATITNKRFVEENRMGLFLPLNIGSKQYIEVEFRINSQTFTDFIKIETSHLYKIGNEISVYSVKDGWKLTVN